MYEFVSLYLPKLGGPTSETIFYCTQNMALSDRIGLKKIQNGVFEQFGGKQ